MNLFDNLQSTMFTTVANTMGYECTWQPTAGGATKTAKVLYNGPTEKEKLWNANYDPDKLTMEYQTGNFDGLKEATDAVANSEVVTIADIGEFYVQKVHKEYDGKSFKAVLQVKTD